VIRKLLTAALALCLTVFLVAGCGDSKSGQPKLQGTPKEELKPIPPGGAPGSGASSKPASE
jgi:hypothetical protein